MKLCTIVLWYLTIIKNRSQKCATPGGQSGRHIDFQYGTKMPSFAHISCSIAPRTKIQVSIPMFSMSRNILAMSEFTSGAGILDFKMAVLHYFVSHFLLHFARKINTLYT